MHGLIHKYLDLLVILHENTEVAVFAFYNFSEICCFWAKKKTTQLFIFFEIKLYT